MGQHGNHPGKHLKELDKRIAWLNVCLARPSSLNSSKRGFDLAERAALIWAVAFIRDFHNAGYFEANR